jgi:hypothetical protein
MARYVNVHALISKDELFSEIQKLRERLHRYYSSTPKNFIRFFKKHAAFFIFTLRMNDGSQAANQP